VSSKLPRLYEVILVAQPVHIHIVHLVYHIMGLKTYIHQSNVQKVREFSQRKASHSFGDLKSPRHVSGKYLSEVME